MYLLLNPFSSLCPDLCFAPPLEVHDDLLSKFGAHPTIDHAICATKE